MKLQHMLLAGVTGALLMFSGCGEDSKDSSTSTTTTSTATFSLTGTVDTSSLSSSDQTLVRSRARGFRAADDEVVKLYTLDANGELVATSITCTVSGGSYTCPSVPGNTEYIVRYVKDLGGGKVLELKTNASVKNTAPDPVKVDPITTMVAEAVVKAVKEAIIGVTSDEALIETIVQSVQKAITDTMTTLVKAGTIKIPSMVVEEDFTDIQTSGTVTTNENLSTATGTVLTNSTVTATITATKTEAEAQKFVELNATAQLLAVFDAIGWDDMPGWVIDMFSAHYDISDQNLTFSELETLMKQGYKEVNATTLAEEPREYEWAIENMVRAGILTGTSSEVNASFVTKSKAVKDALDAKNLITEFTDELTKYYTIKNKAIADRNSSEMEYINHFPAAIATVYPQSLSVSGDIKLQNMAQLFVFMGYMEKVVQDVTASVLNTDKYIGDVRLLQEDLGEVLLGDMFTEQDLLEYNYVSMGKMQLRTQRAWDQSTNTEVEGVVLEHAGLTKLGWDMGMEEANASLVNSAIITYPNDQNTTSTKNLLVTTDWGIGFYLSPWPRDCYSGSCENNMTNFMADAVSGDYTITVDYNGTTYTKTQKYQVIKGLSKLNPKMISPRAYPQWESSYDTTSSDYNATAAAAFNTEWAAFMQEGITNFLPNSDDNNSLEGAVFSWSAPSLTGVTLPANVNLAYSVNISLTKMDTNGDGNVSDTERDSCNQNWENCNTEIYSTWSDNRPITTTSITLPIPLQKTAAGEEYSIGVNAMFIDKETGREVAQGGHTWAQFTVGEGTALTGSENIRFEGNFTLHDAQYSSFPTSGKIALISESHAYNETSERWEHNATVIAVGTIDANTTFTLDVNASVLKDNTGNNKNVNMILFNDENNNTQWDMWTETTMGENAYWLEGQWMWIENWGDLRINVQSQENYTSYKVVKDTNVTIPNFNITIW